MLMAVQMPGSTSCSHACRPWLSCWHQIVTLSLPPVSPQIASLGPALLTWQLRQPLPQASSHRINMRSLLQVDGLEFCHLSPNLLASGAGEGELCVWNLEKPGQPQFCPGLQVVQDNQFTAVLLGGRKPSTTVSRWVNAAGPETSST